MPKVRTWRCGVCFHEIPRRKQNCTNCGLGRRPRPKPKPAHQQVLDLVPYETWVWHFGTRCNICGRPPAEGKRLHRDHDHRTGEPRGLLCHRCNRALPNWLTADWLRKALTYLTRDRPTFDV